MRTLIKILLVFLMLCSNAYAAVLFHDGFESATIPYGDPGYNWKPIHDAVTDAYRDTAQARVGSYSIKFDFQYDNQGEYRLDSPASLSNFDIGVEYWYAISIYVPSDYVRDDLTNTVLMQFFPIPDEGLGESWDRNPVFSFVLRQDEWALYVKADADPVTIKGDYDYSNLERLGQWSGDLGQWTDWAFRVKWSYTSSGELSVYKNGVNIYNYNGMNCYNDATGPYLKFGAYVPTWFHGGGQTDSDIKKYWFDEIRIGDENSNLAEISPVSTYYVCSDGSDSNGCTEIMNDCCATVDRALDMVSEGNTIKIEHGTYDLSSSISIDDTTEHDGITITAHDPDNKPLLEGECSWENVFFIANGVSDVTISYLEIKHCPTGRITSWHQGVIEINENPFTIDNCLIYNGYNGVHVDTGKNVTISNNVIHTMGKIETDVNDAAASGNCISLYNFEADPPATGWNEKIYIYNNEAYGCEDGVINVNTNYRYVEIAYNNFHDNYEDGIDNKDGGIFRIHHNELHDNWSNGIGALESYPNDNFEVYNNQIYNNGWWGIMIQGSNQDNWSIYNNLIYNNCQKPAYYGCNGVNLGGGTGIEFYHNTVYDNSIPVDALNPDVTNAGLTAGSGSLVKNNIFYNNAPRSNGNIHPTATGTFDYNYVYPTTPGITGTNAVTNSSPGFLSVDPDSGDFFKLASDSSCIDSGINVGITDDFDGNVRPANSGFDLGAFERQGAVLPRIPSLIMITIN